MCISLQFVSGLYDIIKILVLSISVNCIFGQYKYIKVNYIFAEINLEWVLQSWTDLMGMWEFFISYGIWIQYIIWLFFSFQPFVRKIKWLNLIYLTGQTLDLMYLNIVFSVVPGWYLKTVCCLDCLDIILCVLFFVICVSLCVCFCPQAVIYVNFMKEMF